MCVTCNMQLQTQVVFETQADTYYILRLTILACNCRLQVTADTMFQIQTQRVKKKNNYRTLLISVDRYSGI
jgi:hypothetical protein